MDSSITTINISYYLKMPMPILYGQFFGKIYQNPEFVKSVCIERNDLFHFACRR